MRHIPKRFAIIMLFTIGITLHGEEIVFFSGDGGNAINGGIISYLDDMVYEFQMTAKQGTDLSIWKRDKEAPPLAPRKAIQSAELMLKKLNLVNNKVFWELSSVQLIPTLVAVAKPIRHRSPASPRHPTGSPASVSRPAR